MPKMLIIRLLVSLLVLHLDRCLVESTSTFANNYAQYVFSVLRTSSAGIQVHQVLREQLCAQHSDTCTRTPIQSSFATANVNRWFWQSSIAVGNNLYIDAGELWYGEVGSLAATFSNLTFVFDLSTSWDTNTVTPSKINTKPSAFGTTRAPKLFYDPIHNTVNSIGGWNYFLTSGGDSPNQVWSFAVDSAQTTDWGLQLTNPAGSTHRPVAGVSVTTPTAFYYLGGYYDQVADSTQHALNTMTTYDFAKQEWSMKTFTQTNFHIFYGEGAYVPIFGGAGVIVYFGGVQKTDDTVAPFSNQPTWDQIRIYDIKTGNYYQQTATNAPTVGRTRSCSVGVGSSKNDTYEIFVYGGTMQSGDLNAANAVWILSLPSFHWIQVDTAAAPWRSDHSCVLIGNRQMLSVGGNQDGNNTAAADWKNWTDWWTNGLQIFDLTSVTWKTGYDPNAAAYQRPQILQSYLDGNPTPPVFSAPEVQALFSASTTKTSTSATAGPTTTPTTTPSSASASTPNNTAAIAGGTAGGVALLAIIAGLFWCCRRRRRHPNNDGYGGYNVALQSPQNSQTPQNPYQQHPHAGQELDEMGQPKEYNEAQRFQELGIPGQTGWSQEMPTGQYVIQGPPQELYGDTRQRY